MQPIPHPPLSRREAIRAVTSMALFLPSFATAQTDLASQVRNLSAQLNQAIRRRDKFEIVRLRSLLAANLNGPYFGQTKQDRAKVRALHAENAKAGVKRISPEGWALAHFSLAQFDFDAVRSDRLRSIKQIRSSIDKAYSVFARNPNLNFNIAALGLNAAALSGDTRAAASWRRRALSAVKGHSVPRELRNSANEASLRREACRNFYMACAQLSAQLGKPQEAWDYFESAQRYADAAPEQADINRKPNTRLAQQQAGECLSYLDAVAAIVVAPAGSVILLAQTSEAGPRYSQIELKQSSGAAFDDSQLEVIQYGKLFREALSTGVIAGWIGPYGADDGRGWTTMSQTFHRALPKISKRIWGHYGAAVLQALENAKLKPQPRVGIVMHDDMASIPLAIAQSDSGGFPLLTNYSISQAGSITALRQSVQATTNSAKSIVGLYNPTGDLPGALAERALVRPNFAASDFADLRGGLSARQFLSALQSSNAGYYYLATHGTFGFVSQSEAGLALGGRQVLSPAAVAKMRGSLGARLMMLSACESGKSAEHLSHKPSSVPNILLAKGVKGIVASLWKVSDTATALLMSETLRLHLAENEEPVDALHLAQRWLRDSTALEFSEYLINQLDNVPGNEQAPVEVLAAKLAEYSDDEKVFSHPYYWAAFAYYGA